MYRLGLFAGVLIVSVLIGCQLVGQTIVTGSGNVVTREEAITGFDRVDASGSFDVDIQQGDAFSVVIHVDDNLVQYLRITKRGNTLELGLRPGLRVNMRNPTLRAEVTLPTLVGVDLSGASHATLSSISSSQSLDIDVSGASSLQGGVEVADITLDVSGSSRVTLEGSGRALKVEASGASTVDLITLEVTDARVQASGASRVSVNTSGRLDAEASGASHINYVGEPQLEVHTSGSSSVGPAH